MKGKGEMTSKQNLKGTTFCPKEESNYFGTGWDGLEQPSNEYDSRGRDLSWDYSNANIPYEGSYLTATSKMGGNVVVSGRGKPKGGRQRLNVSSTLTLSLCLPPFGFPLPLTTTFPPILLVAVR